MASSTSSSFQSRPPPPPSFTAIPEHEQEEEEEANIPRQQHEQEQEQRRVEEAAPPAAGTGTYQHQPTPHHRATTVPKKTNAGAEQAVSLNKCLPSAREKISVVPLDAGGGGHARSRSSSSIPSPGHNGFVKSFFSALTWRSPRRASCSSPPAAQPHLAPFGEGEWRLAATEFSRRLISATRKRDEALAEASRLKYSVAELEKKLARLDSYCRDLRSAPDRFNHSADHHHLPAAPIESGKGFPLEPFLRAISDARSAIRRLGRALVAQLRRDGDPPKAHGLLSQLLQQQDARVLPSGGGSGLLFHLEALLSRAFYEDFELPGFQRGGCDRVLDPRARAEANLASYAALRGLSWEDVLCRGTRHYSDGFSRFCDRKMGEVASSALGGGWKGAWPEPLLRAFFEAAKWVWLVHLLAWCAHPPVPVFRVEKGAPFDAEYMDDVAAPGGRVKRPAPEVVRVMLAPGFYVHGGVVKCRVLCAHRNSSNGNEIGSTRLKANHGRGDESTMKINSRQQKG